MNSRTRMQIVDKTDEPYVIEISLIAILLKFGKLLYNQNLPLVYCMNMPKGEFLKRQDHNL